VSPPPAQRWLAAARELLDRATKEIQQYEDLDTHLDLCLALMEFERVTGEPLGARAVLGASFELMRATKGLAPWLYGGAAQAGWTALTFSELNGTRAPKLAAVDAVVARWVEEYPEDHDVDLPRGVLGLGVYGMCHPAPAVREKVVGGVLRTVDARLERAEGGAFIRLAGSPYRRATAPTDVGHRDMGMAHGNAGLLAFLSIASGLPGAHGSTAAGLLRELLPWLCRQRSEVQGAVFPQSMETRYRSTRSAWCYGDPGVAMALILAADAAGVPPADARAARELAAEAADAVRRRPVDQLGIHDACLCHGAAGLVYFAHRVRDALGGDGWTSFGARWCDDILRRAEQGPLTYLFPPGMRTNPSFLEGDLGAALALLYAATGQRPRWEELMLTAPPAPIARGDVGAA
jgi:hypothetical protein